MATRPATTVVSHDYVAVLTTWRYGTIRTDISVHDFYYALARLGGHQNRTHDHRPGWLAPRLPAALRRVRGQQLGLEPQIPPQSLPVLRPLDMIWSAAVSIDMTDEPDLVREMALVNGSFVLGFDHDGPDVFAKTVDWIEANRLECATFHILTPYPGTPLFAEMESEGRLLHKDWNLYDTGHVVFRPRNMTVEQLAEGYSWCYRRLFSHASIWKLRPANYAAVPPYLAMAYLYKRQSGCRPPGRRWRSSSCSWKFPSLPYHFVSALSTSTRNSIPRICSMQPKLTTGGSTDISI